jgi:hypothetical protein
LFSPDETYLGQYPSLILQMETTIEIPLCERADDIQPDVTVR